MQPPGILCRLMGFITWQIPGKNGHAFDASSSWLPIRCRGIIPSCHGLPRMLNRSKIASINLLPMAVRFLGVQLADRSFKKFKKIKRLCTRFLGPLRGRGRSEERYWLMITFVTGKSTSVPLLEGLCSLNPCTFEAFEFWSESNWRSRDWQSHALTNWFKVGRGMALIFVCETERTWNPMH